MRRFRWVVLSVLLIPGCVSVSVSPQTDHWLPDFRTQRMNDRLREVYTITPPRRIQPSVDPVLPAAAFVQLRPSNHLRAAYRRWKNAHENGNGDHQVLVGLGWSKGLSAEPCSSYGEARLDLIEGSIQVTVHDLADPEIRAVWVIQNESGSSAGPDSEDRMLRVGELVIADGVGTLQSIIPGDEVPFRVALVAITRAGHSPDEAAVLYGAPELFQRLYTRIRREQAGSPEPSDPMAIAASELDRLLADGARVFFEETFDGNGRTCGTCHPARNNFTIDPEFIASLDPEDPLFVAENNPELDENFEKPELMRGLGLILENVDGFDDLETRFVMRGVPHVLALNTSLTPAPNAADGTTIPPVDRTGWSGDGSPGSGTLREFAIGAVRQHFTRTLDRAPGADFRFLTDEELDSLEAFMRQLGRPADPDLSTLRPRGALARRGQEIFLTDDSAGGTVAAGKCNRCHANGGASVSFAPGGLNFNFDTGVEDLPDPPASLIAPGGHPRDGGFGRNPAPDLAGVFGDGTFNTPPLIEAADTAPFFHNNSAQTLEDAVGFYDSETFAGSPSGQFLAGQDTGGIAIRLEPTQVTAIAEFLRVINALENLRSAEELIRAASTTEDAAARRALALLIDADLEDAQQVLSAGHAHPDAVAELRRARDALKKSSKSFGDVMTSLQQARGELAEDSDGSPVPPL